MKTKAFTQCEYVKPFPGEPFQNQRNLCKIKFFFLEILLFPELSYFFFFFFFFFVVGVFPEKRQVELSFELGLRTSCVGSHYCGIQSEQYQNTLVPEYFLGSIPSW